MNKIKLAFVATIGLLVFACGSKTDVDSSIIPVKNKDYQYIDMNQKGKIVINPQFSDAHFFRDGLALVKTSGRDGKWGYIDKKGKYAIAPTYSMAQDFSEGVAWVQIEDQPPMLIDKKGKMLMQIDSITAAKPFANGMSLVKVWSQGRELYALIDKKGETIVAMEEEISGVNEDLYAFKNDGSQKWGFKNKNGEIVINPQFDRIDPFFDGMASVEVGNKWGAIDKNGNYIINPQYDSLGYDSDGLFIAKVGKKWGWVNKKSEIVINPQYDMVGGFAGSKLSPVQMGDKYAYIDKKGQVAINPQFNFAMPFFGDYAMIVNDNAKMGFINQKGDFIVPPLYDIEDMEYLIEYISAFTQKVNNLPMEYLNLPKEYSRFFNENGKVLPYAKLNEKKEEYREMEREKARKTAEAAREAAIEAAKASSDVLTDSRDGKKYKTVKIGEQTWMAENLNYSASGGKCYANDSANCEIYGRHYDWNTAMNSCPEGWHLPSKAEWDVLTETVGDAETAGKHLKAKSGWNSNNDKSGNGEDTYGFAALPGGSEWGGNFHLAGDNGYWWSASERGSSNAYYRFMLYESDGTGWNNNTKSLLLNVRCVKD